MSRYEAGQIGRFVEFWPSAVSIERLFEDKNY